MMGFFMQQFQGRMTTEEKEGFTLASHAVDLLTRSYPGFAWTATCTPSSGVILIREATLQEGHKPFIQHLDKVIHSEKEFKRRMVLIGGEILERYFLPRDSINAFKAHEKKLMLDTDFKGNVLFDKQGIPNYIGS